MYLPAVLKAMSELVVQMRFILERNHFASKSVGTQPRSAGSGEKENL